VQFSKKGVPMMIHDNELKRTTGIDGVVNKTSAEQLTSICAGEEQRFGNRFKDEPVPTLTAVLQLLEQWPKAIAFVEIKTETIECFGIDNVAQRMVSELQAFGDRCVLISFDSAVLEAAKELGINRIGWAIYKWENESLQRAQEFAPDFLFCNYKKIPDKKNALWSGPWRWALYDIVTPVLALRWINQGADLIETWDVGTLLTDQKLASIVKGDDGG
jgi:glycerophosphoryl diester phosphodiesterase